jgi:imidazolonepropionase-like amidohydrolase
MKTMKSLALGAVGLVALAAGNVEGRTTVVRAAHMIDVLAGKRVDNAQVIVTDGRITAVGKAGDAVPAGAEVIDLGPRTLLPGLIDMHVHLTSDPTLGGYRGLEFTDNFGTVVGVANAKKTVEAGFTTVRNVGSDNYDDVAIKQGIEMGYVPGPRIVPATYALGATGGHCDSTEFPPSITVPSPQIANTPDEFRALVRKVRKYGAEVIKICATGGVFSKTDSVGTQQMSFEELKAVADEAHMLGMRVAAHAHGTAGINDALRAGIDTIEHASLADAESFKLAKAKGAWLDMDIYNDDYILAEGEKNGVFAESLAKENDRPPAARNLPRRPCRRGQALVRHRRRRLSQRLQRAPVRQDGGMGHDPDRGDPGRHHQRRPGAGPNRRCRRDRHGALWRPDCSGWRSARRRAHTGACGVRDEGRRGGEAGPVRGGNKPSPNPSRKREGNLKFAGSAFR